jgi:enediyne biosynthesis protein E4
VNPRRPRPCLASLAGLLWLLPPALALGAPWQTIDGGRWQQLTAVPEHQPGFQLIKADISQVRFTNLCAADRHLTNQILLNGSGVAAGDVDGDGLCDLYFCGLDSANALYRNLGNWKFEDISTKAGVAWPEGDATGAALADIDGDGDLDLIVNSVGQGTRVFQNDGAAKFTPLEPLLNPRLGGTSLALADTDGDGDLDLYVANYRTMTLRDQPNTRFNIKMVDGKPTVISVDGRPMTDPDLAHRFNYKITLGEKGGTLGHEENGEPDVLFRNDGGKFTVVPFTEGAFLDEQGRKLSLPPFDWGLSVMFRDFNGDNAPDIYVCNDFKTPDRIWINDGRGTFRALSPLAVRQTCLSSMGVDFADINRDGLDDFLVVDMLSRDHYHRFTQRIDLTPEPLPIGEITNRPQYPRNMLYLNRGDGTYAEIAHFSGLEATEWSWAPVFLDVDLDGYEDLLVSNGFERDGMNVDTLRELELLKKDKNLPAVEQLRLRKMFPRLSTPNLAFRNLGNLKFEDKSAAWGFNEAGVSHGMALADLDNDGDLDVAINNFNAPAGLYRNNASAPRVAVRLKGEAANTHGMGAKIKVLGGPVAQSQEVMAGGRYMSSDEAIRTFAAGASEMTIEVTWRRGKRSVVHGVRAGRLYEIAESAGTSHENPKTKAENPPALFTDVTGAFKDKHIEEPFNDFENQPLLPWRLSQSGPGIAWFDVNSDGWDDVLIGSGKGGALQAFLNNRKGGFDRQAGPPFSQPVTRDQTTILGWRDAQGQGAVLAGSANYEDGLAVGASVRQYDVASKTVVDLIPAQASSTGPLALGDIDNDGDLDLFVGGRVIASKYPQPATSMLFRRSGTAWVGDRENNRQFEKIGLVSGAVFSDIDGDGDADLLLACHWAPLRVFRNTNGKLADVTSELKLDQFAGWWNGITTGDFDNDGRLDIAASNWGRNTRYQSLANGRVRVFHGDVDGNETMEAIEAYQDSGARLLPLQPFHLIGGALPPLRERIGTFDRYAKLTLPEIYGPDFKRLQQLNVSTLDSMVFLNRGTHFEGRALPLEAQWSPSFAVCVSDFDGDGNEDLFLSQNLFCTHPETSRYDSGRGLILKGDGRGGFRAMPGEESGVTVYGEQRGAAVADYDHDGRADLVVTQNAAETRLFRNVAGKPGLRVRLEGPPGNPHGIGATIRVGAGQHFGAARELHAGSGYWSQDSAVAVMHAAEKATHVMVRWPGGKMTQTQIGDAKEVGIDLNGLAKQPH